MEEDKRWSLYLLENSESKRTYLGVTVNIKRRVRQHNGEIKGGARATTNFKGNGEWILKAIVNDLNKSQALSFERTIKNLRRKGKGKTPLERRIYLILQVIPEDLKLHLF